MNVIIIIDLKVVQRWVSDSELRTSRYFHISRLWMCVLSNVILSLSTNPLDFQNTFHYLNGPETVSLCVIEIV